MTNRYELLMNSIRESDAVIVQMFLFAVFVIVSYQSLVWLPIWMRRPAQWLFLAFVLASFILVTVYSWIT